MMEQILDVNGARVSVSFSAGTPLATVLREQLGLASVGDDMAIGRTGASTILFDEFAVIAALVPANLAVGHRLTTAEGLTRHPLADSFRKYGIDKLAGGSALLVSSAALLAANTRPTQHDIRRALAGVRCPGASYSLVIAAVEEAAQRILLAQEVAP